MLVYSATRCFGSLLGQLISNLVCVLGQLQDALQVIQLLREIHPAAPCEGIQGNVPQHLHVIQILDGRRFTYGNLAQLKYIMPEAIVINRILLCDEKTCCMKPVLQVNLLVDAVVGSVMQKGGNRYLTLRKIFRQRLVKFFRNHPEGDDISEHELPHPFTQRSAQITQRVLPEAKSVMPSPCLADQQPIGVSHFPPSFKRIFQRYLQLTA